MNELNLDIEVLQDEIYNLKIDLKEKDLEIEKLENTIGEMNEDLDTIERLAKDAQK